MLDLTRQEKLILLFLAAAFIVGLGFKAYKRSQSNQRLFVETESLTASRFSADKLIRQNSLININSFNVAELTRLPGVGEKLAREIIQYHQSHGPFTSREELLRVNGIGKKKFERFKDSVILE